MHILYGIGIPVLILSPEVIFLRYKPKLFFRMFFMTFFIIAKKKWKLTMSLNLRVLNEQIPNCI